MSGKCFVDTNVLIYAHDASAGPKHVRARTLVENLWNSENGVLSTQVLQEFAATVQRKFSNLISPHELRRAIAAYGAWAVVTNHPHSTILALEAGDRYRISFWDALILAAAQSAGARTLYSEDFSHGQTYGSVQVIDPFK